MTTVETERSVAAGALMVSRFMSARSERGDRKPEHGDEEPDPAGAAGMG
jgi:hypothetical protein